QSEPAWIGYTVPTRGERRVCCTGCTFDDRAIALETGRPVRLEAPQTLVILYRVEDRAIQRIRIFSEECELDAGGRTIHWDEGVPLLIQVAKTNKNAAVRKQAMFWLGQSHDRRALDFFAEVLAK